MTRLLFFLLSFLSLAATANTLDQCTVPEDTSDILKVSGFNSDFLLEFEQSFSIPKMDQSLTGARRRAYIESELKSRLSTWLAPRGYFDETIETLWQCDKSLKLLANIKLGEPIRVKRLIIKVVGAGKNMPELINWSTSFPLKKGDVLRHDQYDRFKSRGLVIANDFGFFDAKYTISSLEIDRNTHSSRVFMTLNTGQRYDFGRIGIADNPILDSVIDGYITFHEGEPFSRKKINQVQRDLYESGYYSAVDIHYEPDAESKTVPIMLNLSANKRNVYNIGLGFETDTGYRASLGYKRHWLSDKGYKLNVDSELSRGDSKFVVGLTFPGSQPASERKFIRVGKLSEDYDESYSNVGDPVKYYSDSARRFLQAGWVEQYGNWINTYYFEWQNESLDVAPEDWGTIKSNLTYPAMSVRYLNTDDILRPQHGLSFEGTVAGGLDNLGSDYNFLYASARAVYTRRLAPKHQLTLRSWLGANIVDDPNSLPSNFRFYLGGDTTIRGYNFRQIGTVENGYNVGGMYQIAANVEYEYFIRDSISLAFFVDGGDAFNDTFSLKSSAGFGVHWYSPVGPIKVELARSNEENNSWLIHLIIGPNL